MSDQTMKIDHTIMDLLAQRGNDKTISPSDVARAIAGTDEKQWRLLMKPIRARAILLAGQNDIVILRKGKPVDPENFKGVYRLGLAPQ
jgi:hypothetical protein